MTMQPQKRPFTVGEYYRMAEAAILTEEDRVELIAGQIVAMSPIGSRHAACVKRLNLLLGKMVGDSMLIGVQDPIALDAYSEPEPDLVLLRPRADFYADAHPVAADVLLAVEVADTSAEYDREDFGELKSSSCRCMLRPACPKCGSLTCPQTALRCTPGPKAGHTNSASKSPPTLLSPRRRCPSRISCRRRVGLTCSQQPPPQLQGVAPTTHRL